jgi:hypothetical protein
MTRIATFSPPHRAGERSSQGARSDKKILQFFFKDDVLNGSLNALKG